MTKQDPVGVREFREKLASYTQPVEVYHTRGSLKLLGTWTPAGYAPEKKKSAKARNRTDG